MKRMKVHYLFIASFAILSFSSCTEDEVVEPNVIEEDILDPNNAINTVFDGKIFSIPSPVQTAYLIKGLNLSFDPSLGNDPENVNDYISEHQQALNLGIYSTDLGYSALYNQKNTTLSYLSSLQVLTNELGLDVAFTDDFLKEFEQNADDDKKMIQLMSDAFKTADNFLKSANRKPASALILTGGWIESMYLACELNAKNPSEEIRKRIGEQKQTVQTIIDILVEYNPDGINDELISSMESLSDTFSKVNISYEYVAPETDAENKITIFRNQTEISMEDKVLSEILKKVEAIRLSIIKK